MASCELTNKNLMFGHNVSHSERKTNRKYLPNLQRATFFSKVLNSTVSFTVCTNAIRTVEKYGDIDTYLSKIKNIRLSKKAAKIKELIVARLSSEKVVG